MISVLYVDDEEPLLEITKIYLEDTGNFNVETLASAPAALERLTDTFYDCIVSDYQMPDMNGIEFLQKLRSQGNETPFIIFTGKGREEVVIEAINSGADFYLQKGGDPKAQFMELAHKIRRAVQVRTVQKQMLEIVQGSPIPMFVIGRDHRVIFWNRALEEYSGIATSGIVGTMDHWKAFYDRQRPCLADLIVDENVDGIARWYSGKEVKSSFVTGAYEATDFFPKIKDGTWLFFTAAPLKDDSGELIGAVETLQDITSLRTKENELRAAYGQMQEALVKTRASETALVEQNIRLEESEQRYHNVVETQTEFICRFLPDGTHIFVNEAYCRYFGLKREEIVGKQFRADIHPEDKEKFRDHFASLTLDHPMAIITHRVIMPDGEVRWHRWSDQAIFDEHGSLIEYQSVGLDITEQKLAESALLESERQQAEIIDFLPDATLVIDRQGKVIAWNRAIEEMTGVPAGDMLGKDDYEYALPFYGSRRPILIDLIFESDETIAKEYYGIIHRKGSLLIAETSLPRPRGKQAVLWGKASPLYDEQGTIIGAIESIRDVTERRDMEDAIRQREQQLDVIMKNLPVSMFRTTPGPEGSIVMANPLLARMFGYDSPEEFMAGSVARLYADPKKREEFSDLLLKNGSAFGFENQFRKKNGELFWARESAVAVPGPDGYIEYFDGVLEDISGRRKAEEQLRAEHEIALVLNSASALDAVLPLCLATAIRLSGMDAGGIYLVNEDTGDLELACSSGLSGEFIRETSRISAGSDSAGLVSAGRPVYSQHRNLGVSLTGTREKEGLRAIAIIPILSKNRVIACFNIASHSREVVPEENRRALETIAGQIGGGIARLRAEEARKTSEEHLRTVMQAVQTGILIIDTATHTIVDANRKALAMIGAAEDEVIGAVCHRFICPFEEGKCPVTDMQQEIDVSERVLVTSRGERVPVLKTVSPAVIQGRPVLVESFIDISELKKKEERIRILAGLLDLIPASVTVHDAEGRFLYANATTFDYHGYSEDEFYKINLHQLDTPETERLLAGRIQEGLKKILMPPFEVGHFRKDRSVLPLLVNAKTMEWEGRPVFLSVATDITERKKMEEALRESETRFRNIVNLAQDGIWAVDPEGITTFVNRRMAEMLGYTAEEMTGSPMQRFMDEKGRGIAARNYPKYRQGIQEQVEFEFVRKDKTRITALVSNTSLFDSSGTFTGALAVVSDITARKKAEDALRESERKYRILIDNANEGIVVAQGGYLKFVNKKTAEISGYSETELLSRPFAGFIHESDREMIASRYDQRTSGKAPPADYEFRLLHKSGSVRWLEIRPVLITWEGSPATLNFISDITERKQAEEAFRLSEEKYRTLVERSQEGVFITQDQRVVFANAAFARMLGYTVDGITGRDIREGIAPGDLERVIDLNRRRLAGEQVPEFYELTMQHCDGKTKIPVSMSVGMIQYQGRPAAMGTLRDITELKQIQEALIQTNKKLAMLSSVTRHDMLNMITAIHGYHELIHVVEDDRKVLELLAKEEAAINAIERQIAFTREYECLGVKAPRWQRVHDVIEKAVSQFDLKGVKVKNSTRGLEVFADAMLEKVFYNLTDNALRYGSTITSISISHKKSGDGRLIAYEDDGIGIPKSEKERIFSKGFGQNTGLGLFLAQEILSITGISIKETGTSGKGACFEILIPKGAYRIKKKD